MKAHLVGVFYIWSCLILSCAGVRNKVSGQPDGAVPTDMSPADMASHKTDSTSSPSALQVVINKIKLPDSTNAYAMDLDGNGSMDNQIGTVVAAIKTFGSGVLTLQQDLDQQFLQGKILMLLQVFARSLLSDPSVKLRLYLGRDLDSNPKDNYSGSEPLGLQPGGPKDMLLSGKIAGATIKAGPGKMVVPIPIGGSSTVVTLRKAHLSASVAKTGMTMGQINGAIPFTEVEGKLLPDLAKTLDITYKVTGNLAKKQILAAFDTDKNGTITVADLKKNSLIGMLFKADVDSDGDGKLDAMSLGIGFTAVPCLIK